jgi:uncharacterized protein (DUF1501 family)
VAEQRARPALHDRLGRPPRGHRERAQLQPEDLDVGQRGRPELLPGRQHRLPVRGQPDRRRRPQRDGHLADDPDARYAAQQNILNLQEQNLFEAAFGGTTTSAIADSQLLNSILTAAPKLTTVFPTTSIGSQLQMIAQMIGAAPQLGLTRQVFFASLGGFDLHSDQLARTPPSSRS